MKEFWDDYWPISVIIALFLGLVGQFIWKMIYFPEPIGIVIFELVFIIGVVILTIVQKIRY